MRVLIVDDEPHFSQPLGELFAGNGHHVHTAETGAEALRLVHKCTYDVVLLDFHLPDNMTGIDVLRHMRGRKINTPVIVISGGDDFDQHSEELSSLGVRSHIFKASRCSDFLHEVAKIVSAQASQVQGGEG